MKPEGAYRIGRVTLALLLAAGACTDAQITGGIGTSPPPTSPPPTVTPSPVPIPTPAPTPLISQHPQELALQLEDLPAGFRLRREEARPAGGGTHAGGWVREYERASLLGIVVIYSLVDVFGSIALTYDLAAYVRDDLAQGGVPISPGDRIGDESQAVEFQEQSGGSAVVAQRLYVRYRNVISIVTIGGAKGTVDFSTALELGRKQLDRLQRARTGTVGQLVTPTPTPATTLAPTTVSPLPATAAPRTPVPVVTPGPTPPPATPTPRTTYRIGEVAAFADGWRATVLRLEEQPAGTYTKPSAGMRFVAVILRFDNGSAQSVSLSPFLELKVQDSAGVRRRPQLFSDRNDALSSGRVAPGSFVSGSVTFEAPIGDSRLQLVYDRGYSYPLVTFILQ